MCSSDLAITKKNPFKKKSKTRLITRIKHAKKIVGVNKFIKIRFFEDKIKSNKTIDLINYMKKKNKKLNIYFIMGADNLIKFHKWNKWKDITRLCKIIVFDRYGYKSKALSSIASKYMKKNNWKFVKFSKINISSSQIRNI